MRFNMRRILVTLAVLLAASAPVARTLDAQVFTARIAPRGWLGISYDEVIQQNGGQRTSTVTITQVMKDSPAEKAGVQVGDTVVRVNDLRASTELMQSLGASVDVGDVVRIVVRRDGREHTLPITVAKRPPQEYTYVQPGQTRMFRFDPDSVRGMMRLFADSMYAGLDTMHMRVFRYDTTGFKWGADTMFFRAMPYGFGADSLRKWLPAKVFGDSTLFLPGGGGTFIFGDSLQRRIVMRGDSVFGLGRIRADSLLRALPKMDMMIDVNPGEWHTSDMVFGYGRTQSAFAGAELVDLNPDLGEYFGAKSGLLVLRVPAGSPAARAGLEPGDIVTRVDGAGVSSMAQLRRNVERVKRGAPIKLEIVRHKKTQTLELQRD
jgi:membrane-associated protease RseP (regulator of RpoE activity)